MFLLILGLVLFLLLVVLHEFGHFIAARRGGVEVEEFGIGFPPKLLAKRFKRHKTVYTWNLLPLGGFVRLKGEHDRDTAPGSYGAARLTTKIKIMLAGVGMNFLIAWLMLLILCLIGMPLLPLPGDEKQFNIASDTKVTDQRVFVAFVEPDSPAEQAGLQVSDKIRYITSHDVDVESGPAIATGEDLRQRTESLSGTPAVITIERGSETLQLKATLRGSAEVLMSRQTDDPKGYLGVVPYEYALARSTWSAPITAAGLTFQYTKITFKSLGAAIKDLFTGNAARASDNVSGPVGIFFVLKDGSTFGYRYVLLIIALLSLTLAIMNVLPIPALDGGRLFVTMLYRGLKRPLLPKVEERIHLTGFAALMLLFVVITVVDVRRFF